MHCVVARIAPRVARARITPSSVPTARVPTEKGFTGVGGRVAGAARALSWTAAPHQASSRTAILRARVSHRAHPRAALASPPADLVARGGLLPSDAVADAASAGSSFSSWFCRGRERSLLLGAAATTPSSSSSCSAASSSACSSSSSASASPPCCR